MTSFRSLVRCASASGEVRYRLGDPLVDRYLQFAAGRARPNTVRAVAFDLKTFFTVVAKDPVEVAAGVLRAGDVVRLDDLQAHRVERVVLVDDRVVVELRPVGLDVSNAVRVTVPVDRLVERLGTAGV